MRIHALSCLTVTIALVSGGGASASIYEYKFESSIEGSHGSPAGATSGRFSLRARFDSSPADGQPALPLFGVSITPIDLRAFGDAAPSPAPAALAPHSSPDGVAFQICFVLAGIAEGAVEIRAGADPSAESGEPPHQLSQFAFDAQWTSLVLPPDDDRPAPGANDTDGAPATAQRIPSPGALALFAIACAGPRRRRAA